MTWILTRSGKRVDLLAPSADMIDPLDIAHSLAHQCRFNGHTTAFYSVAQHCYLVADLVPAEHQLHAILHDATETYVGDMVRPLKQLMPDYAEVEHEIWLAICERFNVEPQLPECVKHADLVALATERRDLMPAHPGEWECLAGIDPMPAYIKPWTPNESALHYFNRLMTLLGTANRRRAVA